MEGNEGSSSITSKIKSGASDIKTLAQFAFKRDTNNLSEIDEKLLEKRIYGNRNRQEAGQEKKSVFSRIKQLFDLSIRFKPVPNPEAREQFRNTESFKKRVKGLSVYEEPDRESINGYFKGRPVIGKDTPINGGVYVGGGEREAIVVDERKDTELQRIYNQFLNENFRQPNIQLNQENILLNIFQFVKREMPANEDKAERLAEPFYNDAKVTLGYFIANKAGVCRHQALLTAFIAEKLIQQRALTGKISIDRNTVRGRGGHAWARYTLGQEVYIIDPTQNLIARLKDIPDTPDYWQYRRPVDQKYDWKRTNTQSYQQAA